MSAANKNISFSIILGLLSLVYAGIGKAHESRSRYLNDPILYAEKGLRLSSDMNPDMAMIDSLMTEYYTSSFVQELSKIDFFSNAIDTAFTQYASENTITNAKSFFTIVGNSARSTQTPQSTRTPSRSFSSLQPSQLSQNLLLSQSFSSASFEILQKTDSASPIRSSTSRGGSRFSPSPTPQKVLFPAMRCGPTCTIIPFEYTDHNKKHLFGGEFKNLRVTKYTDAVFVDAENKKTFHPNFVFLLTAVALHFGKKCAAISNSIFLKFNSPIGYSEGTCAHLVLASFDGNLCHGIPYPTDSGRNPDLGNVSSLIFKLEKLSALSAEYNLEKLSLEQAQELIGVMLNTIRNNLSDYIEQPNNDDTTDCFSDTSWAQWLEMELHTPINFQSPVNRRNRGSSTASTATTATTTTSSSAAQDTLVDSEDDDLERAWNSDK